MSEIAVENVNVADILGHEEAEAGLEKVKAALEADPEISALMKVADTIEDVYEIVKRFSKATFEQVKVLFKKTVDYLKETKAILSDEVLDNVSGGWFLSDWWHKAKSTVVGTVIMVSCIVAGTVAGACVGGLGGAVCGACVGALAGAAIAYTTCEIIDSVEKK